MSNKAKLTALISATVVIAVFFLWSRFSAEATSLIPAPDRSSSNTGNLPVDIYVFKNQFLANSIQTTGTLLASEETALFSESSGKVTHIFFNEGEYVKKGTLLFQLNDKDLVAQLDRIRIEKSFAETTLARQKQLFDKGGISQEQFDQAQNRVNVLQAQIEETLAKIEKTQVRAPFDGIIGLRQISNGAYLTPSVPTATIQNLDILNLEFSVPEKYFNRVKPGDEITFSVSNGEKEYKAEIYAIEPQIDINTRTVVMRARFNNREDRLLPGLFAYITYNIDTVENALLVPSQAIVPELKGQKVFVYNNGTIDEKAIDTGIRTDVNVQVTKGLQVSDSVVVTGILQVRKGMPVRIRNILN
jgi:membrane fusion protein (multidrug efflux system)